MKITASFKDKLERNPTYVQFVEFLEFDYLNEFYRNLSVLIVIDTSKVLANLKMTYVKVSCEF